MNFTKKQVFEMCQKIAPEFGFDPKLIMAICIQESAKTKDGRFAADVARLEQGYYRRYVKNMSLATTTEILFSASYGVMQMMGLSLKEAGFFTWWYNQLSKPSKVVFGSPLSAMSVPFAINEYCVNLEWMIRWGCKHFEGKLKRAKGDTTKALGYWNGDLSGEYASEVLEKKKRLKS